MTDAEIAEGLVHGSCPILIGSFESANPAQHTGSLLPIEEEANKKGKATNGQAFFSVRYAYQLFLPVLCQDKVVELEEICKPRLCSPACQGVCPGNKGADVRADFEMLECSAIKPIVREVIAQEIK